MSKTSGWGRVAGAAAAFAAMGVLSGCTENAPTPGPATPPKNTGAATATATATAAPKPPQPPQPPQPPMPPPT